MNNDVVLGLGMATGMFYHAPKGTSLPAYPLEPLSSAWKHVGDVSADGITLTTDKSTESLRNWANKVKRVIMSEHAETIEAPVMDTTEESLKTVLGANNVTVTPANGTHGKLITASLSAGSLPAEEAFLFLMKDGDTTVMIGCTDGQIQSVANTTFAPNAAINWTPTITALGDGFVMVIDDGGSSS